MSALTIDGIRKVHLFITMGLLGSLLISCTASSYQSEPTSTDSVSIVSMTPDLREERLLSSPVTPSPEYTHSDDLVATTTCTVTLAATEAYPPALRCVNGGSIVFVARSQGTGAFYLLCRGEGKPTPIMPLSPDEAITGLDISSDGRLVYSGSNVSTGDRYLFIQLSKAEAPVRFADGDIGGMVSPRWILDDTRIVFIDRSTPDALAVLDIEERSGTTVYEENTIGNLHVSSDDSTVLFTASTGQPNVQPSTMVGTLVCSGETCHLADLRQIDNIENNPTWAQSGKSIASISYQQKAHQEGVYIYLRLTSLDGVIEQEIELTELEPALENVGEVVSTPDLFLFIGHSDGADNLYALSVVDYTLERLTSFSRSEIRELVFYTPLNTE